MAERVNVDLLMKSLSEILSDKYDVRISITAVPKPDVDSGKSRGKGDSKAS